MPTKITRLTEKRGVFKNTKGPPGGSPSICAGNPLVNHRSLNHQSACYHLDCTDKIFTCQRGYHAATQA